MVLVGRRGGAVGFWGVWNRKEAQGLAPTPQSWEISGCSLGNDYGNYRGNHASAGDAYGYEPLQASEFGTQFSYIGFRGQVIVGPF